MWDTGTVTWGRKVSYETAVFIIYISSFWRLELRDSSRNGKSQWVPETLRLKWTGLDDWLDLIGEGSNLGWGRSVKMLSLKFPWDIQLDKSKAVGYLDPNLREDLVTYIWESSEAKDIGEVPVWKVARMWERGQMVEPWAHHSDRDGGRNQVKPKRLVSLKPRQKALISSMNPPELRWDKD